jgi:glycosyltransferase involved in cell wall biosynthesis
MACGTVPIVSNRSSLPEVVGDVGLLVEPEDYTALATAMESALTDREWRETMRQAGLARAKTFTWDETASIVLSAYEVVCRF